MAAEAQHCAVGWVKFPFGALRHWDYMVDGQNLTDATARLTGVIALLLQCLAKSFPWAISNAPRRFLLRALPVAISRAFQSRSVSKFFGNRLSIFWTLPVYIGSITEAQPEISISHSPSSCTDSASRGAEQNWFPTINTVICSLLVILPMSRPALVPKLPGEFCIRRKALSPIPGCSTGFGTKASCFYTIGVNLECLTAFDTVQCNHAHSISESTKKDNGIYLGIEGKFWGKSDPGDLLDIAYLLG